MKDGVVAIKNCEIITPFKVIKKGTILIKEGKISKVGTKEKVAVPKDASVIDASGKIAIPGFIDNHAHGALGHSLGESYETISEITKYYATRGVTAFLADLCFSYDELLKRLRVVRKAMEKGTDGAEIVGINLEGPYGNEKKGGSGSSAAGVGIEWRSLSIGEFEQIMKESNNAVKLMVVAPELEGALDFIKYITKRGVVASLGITYATYDEAMAGVKAGIRNVDHVFNNMSVFHHRELGASGVALICDELTTELIADGHHVHPGAVKIVYRCKGPDRIILVTDSTEGAGLPEGGYTFGGIRFVLRDGKFVIPKPPVTSPLAGTPQEEKATLAGSIIGMDDGVRNTLKFVGLPLQEAIRMATINPAKRTGVDGRMGSLEKGKDANIAIVDKDLNVYTTLVKGKVVYKRS